MINVNIPENKNIKIPKIELSPILGEENTDILTYQDSENGAPQYYHAYVLHADEDRDFVDEIIKKMNSYGYKVSQKRGEKRFLVFSILVSVKYVSSILYFKNLF